MPTPNRCVLLIGACNVCMYKVSRLDDQVVRSLMCTGSLGGACCAHIQHVWTAHAHE